MQTHGETVEIGAIVLLLALPTIVMNIPLIVLCLIARRRLSKRQISWTLTCGFVAVNAWFIWYMSSYRDLNSFPLQVVLLTYIPTFFALGWIGWFIGRWIGRDAARDAATISPTTITR